jgi:hypothetical protein
MARGLRPTPAGASQATPANITGCPRSDFRAREALYSAVAATATVSRAGLWELLETVDESETSRESTTLG